MAVERNPQPRETPRSDGGLLVHAGMPPEHRLAVVYEELSAMTRYARMDLHTSNDCKRMAERFDVGLKIVWGVICELADERVKENAK